MVKTAIIGASGFVGRYLFEKFRQECLLTVGTSFSHSSAELKPFDIRNPCLASLALEKAGTRDVLIASANPNIGFCEQNPEASYSVNVTGTLEVIRQVVAAGLRPIFLSSDYVFNGETGGYDDFAITCPTTEYGRQKQLVEDAIPKITTNYLILRLSKIYGTQKGDKTLLDEIAQSLFDGKEIHAATDQKFSPTHVDDLVAAILAIQESGLQGTVNLCAPRSFSRYEIASSMAEALGVSADRIIPIKLYDLPSMQGRPLNTSLKSSRLESQNCTVFTSLEQNVAKVASLWR